MNVPGIPTGSPAPAALAAALMLAVAGCSAGPAPAPSASSPSSAVSSPAASSPAASSPAASSDAALQEFDQAALEQTFRDAAQELRVPGAVMLLRTPGGNLTYTYGVRSFGGTDPVTAADHVRIGSITKTWTTTVILQLVQEGKIKLQDAVADYRPDVPNGANITIEQLLTMRSGLYNYTEALEVNQVLDADPAKAWTPRNCSPLPSATRPISLPARVSTIPTPTRCCSA
ncbi:serine hydrolase domain-containing protein [Arthrobacter sp. UNC362MFTsu5.1]|uniref:serine hydrolase domain-containing protein n=1 Tax=Arthrobacter sp. UNC362MFTsu5.1 TaxID=1449044 RepID=UPI000B0D176C|nr:serine hydrolase domain-containing protein [Arthrobacter sp. UNC362MFTsu5.1]